MLICLICSFLFSFSFFHYFGSSGSGGLQFLIWILTEMCTHTNTQIQTQWIHKCNSMVKNVSSVYLLHSPRVVQIMLYVLHHPVSEHQHHLQKGSNSDLAAIISCISVSFEKSPYECGSHLLSRLCFMSRF